MPFSQKIDLRPGRRRQKNLLVLAMLVLLPCAWWWPLLSGDLPNFMDTITYAYPIRMAAARQLREGTLPLWLPELFSGTPLAANPQIAVWYPPQLLFYLLPGALSFGVLCVLHYVWGGWGAYLYVRRLTGSLGGALFAALTFQFSAMLVSRLALLPHVYTVVWVPWMLLAAEKALGERGYLPRRGALAISLLFSMQILAGAPQISYYTGLILPLYWLFRAAVRAKRESAPMGRRLAEVVVQGGVAAVVAALIASIQLLPTAEFLQNSDRSPVSLEHLRGQALNDGFIWRSVVGFTGDTIEDTDSINAIGLGAMALALFALARRRTRRLAWPLWLVGVLSFALSLGPLVDLWATVLPLYEGFHAPRRALVMWTVVGSLAAGLGGALLDARWRLRRRPRAAFYGLLLLLSGGTWWMLPRLERVFVAPEHLDADRRYVERIGPDRFLTMDPTFAYSYDSRRPDFGKSLVSDLAALHGLHDANGYDPLVTKRYALARRLACATSGVFYPSHGVFFSDPNSPVLKLLNVQYLVGRHDLYDPSRLVPGTRIDHEQLSASLELVYGDLRWPLFRYRETRPLAWAVEQVIPARGPFQALQMAMQSETTRTAWIEEDIAIPPSSALPAISAKHRNGRTISVSFDRLSERENFVCVATTWMPGWSAIASNGEKLVTTPANGLIAGIVVPPGVESFDLIYRPFSFVRGALLTLVGLLGWALLLVRARRGKEAEGTQDSRFA